MSEIGINWNMYCQNIKYYGVKTIALVA